MPEFLGIDHVQLCMPAGAADAARAFYVGVLGMAEIDKPTTLNQSVPWFAAGGVELHFTVEADFRAARAAHPGIRVSDVAAVAERCRSAGYEPRFDTRYPGRVRFYVADPFGNRLEFLYVVDAARATHSHGASTA
ncbi:MAG: VOC family protein [Gemmatimonadaceae bacterium]